MVYLIILFILIILILVVRLLLLRREISRISKDLHNLNSGSTHGKLTVSMLHAPLEDLCVQANRKLEEYDKARIDAENQEAELRTQIANISHDLRTPLTAILGYISMTKSTPEKAPDYMEIIEYRARALQTLVEQFYELSIMEDSYTEWEPEPVDVTAVLTDCLLGNYTLFEAKGIRPVTDLPEQAVTVVGNTCAMERIFQNLIQNALKYASNSIMISLTADGVFTITNDAENLTEADMAHLFERFYTADKSRSAGSTGLGLYIVKRLLEKTGGGIRSVKLENGFFILEIFITKPDK